MLLEEGIKTVRLFGESENTGCLRKSVGCMLATKDDKDYTMHFLASNGPVNHSECSNEVGNCGCMHSEIRVVMKSIGYLKRRTDSQLEWQRNLADQYWIMICTYSPCTNCANFIVEYAPWIKEVRFEILTDHDIRGRDRLQDAGIKCQIVR